MDNEIKIKFVDIIKKYDLRDLFALLILCSSNYSDVEIKSEFFDGIKNLFAKIACFYNFSSNNKKVEFLDEDECNNICNSLINYLSKKYESDYNELMQCVEQNKMSYKQCNYELASPKTFPKTFIDTLIIKLQPFENFLIAEYDLSINHIKKSCEKIIRKGLGCCTSQDLVNHTITNITSYFNSKFLDDLIGVNEKKSYLNDINSFDKFVCFPVIKISEEYHVLSYEVFIDNFYKCIHRLFNKKANKIQKDELSNLKGQIFNDNCENLFKNLGFSNIYSNFKYDGGEVDLLIEDKDVLFVIECKARNYTDKISGLYDSFEKANERNLDFASKQIHRFIDFLKENKTVVLKKNTDSIKLSFNKYNYIIPLVINLENLAELNADFINRDKNTVYISFDDLKIISDVIENRKFLLIDFFDQLFRNNKITASVDDVIDLFAFYCQCKNLGIVFTNEIELLILKLGNDYFQSYFSYKDNIKPLNLFDNDISTFISEKTFTYKDTIEKYHRTYWKSLSDFIK